MINGAKVLDHSIRWAMVGGGKGSQEKLAWHTMACSSSTNFQSSIEVCSKCFVNPWKTDTYPFHEPSIASTIRQASCWLLR